MKKSKLLLILSFCQCVPSVDFAPPELPTDIDFPVENTNFQAILERVNQSETGFVKFGEHETLLWTSGYVTSSDTGGNFYKELYLQDHPNRANVGLRILLDQKNIHATFNRGRKVFIRLNGLGAGIHKGVLSLGSYQADGVANLPSPLIKSHLIRSDQIAEIKPMPIQLGSINPSWTGQWTSVSGVQFAKSELGKTFSSEAFDTFNGERRLVTCGDYWSIFLNSSTFAKFKSLQVSSLSGIVEGVLTRDYNEKYILKINDATNIHFEGNRCDPFFEQSFENQPLGRFALEGWQNYIEEGTQYWEVYEDENSLGQSLRIGSYRSRDKKTVCWLITPAFNLNEELFFSFRSSTKFADNSKLEVLISSNYDGNTSRIGDAHWEPLNLRVANKNDNDILWIDSGRISLKSYTNVVHFAFRYTGSGKTVSDGTFELDDILVNRVPKNTLPPKD